MKKLFSVLLAAMLLIALTVGIAETAAEPPAAMFTINVTQLLIAIIGVVFSALLAWIVRAVIPPLKGWLDEHTTTEQQTRAWTMIKWLVEAAEQTITGYAKGSERLDWVISELKRRGIEVDRALVEAAVKEMKDKAGKEINDAIHGKDPCAGKDYCEIE
jgi:fucose permease